MESNLPSLDLEEPLNPSENKITSTDCITAQNYGAPPSLVSNWHYIFPFHFIPCTKFDNNNKGIYCGYWKCSSIIPLVCAISMLSCYIIHFVAIFPILQNLTLKIISAVEISLMVILFFVSFFESIFYDPGYLPINWSETKKTKYSWQEIMSGTAISEDQISYVISKPKPPGCSFSKSVGRYIIRGDHFCIWINNWVGKRNHKQFTLFPFYGILADFSLIVWRFVPSKSLLDISQTMFALEIIALMFEALYLFILTSSFFFIVKDILSSQTKIQKYKKIKKTDEVSNIAAFREICGNRSMFCWLCPTSAFPEVIDLEEINNSYVPDPQIENTDNTPKKEFQDNESV